MQRRQRLSKASRPAYAQWHLLSGGTSLSHLVSLTWIHMSELEKVAKGVTLFMLAGRELRGNPSRAPLATPCRCASGRATQRAQSKWHWALAAGFLALDLASSGTVLDQNRPDLRGCRSTACSRDRDTGR